MAAELYDDSNTVSDSQSEILSEIEASGMSGSTPRPQSEMSRSGTTESQSRGTEIDLHRSYQSLHSDLGENHGRSYSLSESTPRPQSEMDRSGTTEPRSRGTEFDLHRSYQSSHSDLGENPGRSYSSPDHLLKPPGILAGTTRQVQGDRLPSLPLNIPARSMCDDAVSLFRGAAAVDEDGSY